nr:MAG TPA: hypothetical protein [Caudoviricetes sp.]
MSFSTWRLTVYFALKSTVSLLLSAENRYSYSLCP